MGAKGKLTEKMFTEYIAANIKGCLPEHLQEWEFKAVEQLDINGIIQPAILCLRSGETVFPTVYTGMFLEQVQQGRPIGDAMKDIAGTIDGSVKREIALDVDGLKDYGEIRQHLSMRLINTKANIRKLADMPHRTVEDLSAYYFKKLLSLRKDEVASISVKNQYMDVWNVSEEQLYTDAVRNEKGSATLTCMDVWHWGMGDNLLTEEYLSGERGLPEECMLFLLTNRERVAGASMIMLPEVMENVSRLFPQGFYILPSSLHEVMIVPKDGDRTLKELGEFVREVNRDVVKKQEVLSDRVYEYDRGLGRITTVPESIPRKERGMER